jgi:hypothetical protein
MSHLKVKYPTKNMREKPTNTSITKVIPKVMSDVAWLATLQNQMIEYRLVGGANFCHVFE